MYVCLRAFKFFYFFFFFFSYYLSFQHFRYVLSISIFYSKIVLLFLLLVAELFPYTFYQLVGRIFLRYFANGKISINMNINLQSLVLTLGFHHLKHHSSLSLNVLSLKGNLFLYIHHPLLGIIFAKVAIT